MPKSKSAPKPAKAKPTKKAKPAARKVGPRTDLGGPIDPFFSKQPPHLREILDALRSLVEEAAPDATATLKWGMPFYEIDGATMCALGAHTAHVNLILHGPGALFPDPDGRLRGTGKAGHHLRIEGLADLPRTEARAWLRAAAVLARMKGR